VSTTDEVVLVLNAGSSSIKFCAFGRSGTHLERRLRGQISGIGTSPHLFARSGADPVADRSVGDDARSHADALGILLDFLRGELQGSRIVGVGHRVVHGGLEFMAPTRVDVETLSRLERYIPLAPLHQPHNLAAIRLMLQQLPGVPEVACFDTAFHSTGFHLSCKFLCLPKGGGLSIGEQSCGEGLTKRSIAS
jgi:acetate kinase